ncbi:MAG TPA: putative DNA-binding domain-containing protein [Methylophilaceae bacterium]|nr:putative DNA-binding domain-containing protein [Methylophilaceae bacterium]
MNERAELPAFQRYQLQFSGHIRNPAECKHPRGVVSKRMRVYTEIVFNNLYASVSACFPVARQVLGIRAWRRLVRSFFVQHRCHSPLFRQIPEEFLRYLDGLDEAALAALPPFLKQLAHYEWIELALAVADVEAPQVDPKGDLLAGQPILVPALALLSYDYPVQRISKRFQPAEAESVSLLVFRNAEDEVRFVELNAVTARLLAIMQAESLSGREALEQVAAELAHPDPQTVVQFGLNILADLRTQGAILGTVEVRR